MAGKRNQRKPTFIWQAVLILLPVIVLAAVGWASLRQDRILAQHDATERAQTIANDLILPIWNELTNKRPARPKQFSFQVNIAGQLIFPPPYDSAPTPKPFDLTALNSDQARLWHRLQNADFVAENLEALGQAYNDFIASDPPENFAPVAHYGLGLVLQRREEFLEAAGRFDLIVEKYPNAIGESGLPLQPLAQFRLFNLLPHKDSQPVIIKQSRPQNVIPEPRFPDIIMEHFISLDSLCSNLVYHPTPLTSYLLYNIQERWAPEKPTGPAPTDVWAKYLAKSPEMAKSIDHWQRLWTEHEMARELFAAASQHFNTNASAGPQSTATTKAKGEQEHATTNRLLSALAVSQPGVEWPHVFWISSAQGWKTVSPKDRNWLAVQHSDNATSHWFVCRAESELGPRLSELVHNTKRIPQYFGVGIEVAGKKLGWLTQDLRLWHYEHHGGKSGHVDKEHSAALATNVLASASHPGDGVEALKVMVYLTSPAALFESQRTRAFWFVSLISISTIAALFGLFAAWGAFNRQQRLADMKSNFVSSVSHELRAPIASVRLMAESLERGKVQDEPKRNEYFRFIVQECRRLSSLIENVLDFSRIEQGRKQYEFEPTDLATLTRETVKLMEPYAAEREVRLETSNIEHRTSNIELNVDGRAIQQALVNLIDNAIKHSPKGETVTVGLEVVRRDELCESPIGEAQSGPRVTRPSGVPLNPQPSTINFSVTDHGPGIPASEHDKIFERFYRLGSELRRETQGVGIGLSIVKHIVEAHGGRVTLESEPGNGSRFVIELPSRNETSNIEH